MASLAFYWLHCMPSNMLRGACPHSAPSLLSSSDWELPGELIRNNARRLRDRSSEQPKPEHAHIAQAVPAVLSVTEQAPNQRKSGSIIIRLLLMIGLECLVCAHDALQRASPAQLALAMGCAHTKARVLIH